MSILERYFAPATGAIREFVGLSAYVEPADPTLYRRLLPAPFTLPERPLVQIMVVDYLKVAPWPLRRWQEWGVLLKCEWRGEVGWYPVTMPVTRWLPMSAGRYLGYPKYVADSISLARDGDRWRAQAVHRGVRQLGMAFEPGVAHRPEPWEAELATDPSLFKGDVYLLTPPGAGPTAQRVSLTYVEAHWSTERGSVRLDRDDHEPWADLVPNGESLPGEVSHFVGGFNLHAERLAPDDALVGVRQS